MIMEFSWLAVLEEFLKVIFGAIVMSALAAIGYIFKEYILWRFIKTRNSSYSNDTFARETIKYRFNNIFSSINKTVSSDKPILSYKTFQDTLVGSLEFTDNSALLTQGNEINKAFMKLWVDQTLTKYKNAKVSAFLSESNFIDAEYLFYYYILDKLNNLDLDSKKKLHPGYCPDVQFDPYKVRKIKMLEDDFINDSEEKSGSSYKSKIKPCLNIIARVNGRMDDASWKDLIYESSTNILQVNLSSNSSDLSQMFWSDFNSVYPHINHSKKFWIEYMNDVANKNVHIIVDNFGIEFLSDLVLGYCLKIKGACTVTYHVKHLPIFVSDVVENDQILMFETLKKLLSESKENEEKKTDYINALNSLENMAKESFRFKANYFFNMPFGFAELQPNKLKIERPDALKLIKETYSIFTGEDLLIIKGDLNYRRLVEDKLWNHRVKTSSRIKYATAPMLVIRSYKSSVVMDCSSAKVKSLVSEYGPDWKTDGQVGAILFFNN